MIRPKAIATLARALIVALTVVFLASCATAPGQISGSAFSALGDGALCYLVFPVREHQSLARRIGGQGEENLARAIDRTDRLWAGLYPASGSAEVNNSIRLVASGSYPKSARSLVFPSSKGWVPALESAHGPWYFRGSEGGSIPRSGLYVQASVQDLPSILERLDEGTGDLSYHPPALDEAVRTNSRDPRLILWAPDPVALFSPLLQGIPLLNLSAPARDLIVFAQRDATTSDRYNLSARFETTDAKNARAFSALFRLALRSFFRTTEGITEGTITSEGTFIRMEGYSLSDDSLADLIRFFYF